MTLKVNALHPRQREAIVTHDRNLIVMAGAGSGKTRVLVERYLALLEAHPEWSLSSLVAVTFTQKAAREMRDRVRQEIELRIANCEPTDTTSLQVWRDRQSALGAARIGTIHSLCTAILRANAAEIGIDPEFTVLDETDAAILADEAVEDALAQIADEGSPAVRLLLDYDPDDVRRELRSNMFCDDAQLPAADSPLERWRSEYTQIAGQFLTTWLQDSELRRAVFWRPAQMPDVDDKMLDQWHSVWAGWEKIEHDPAPTIVLEVAVNWCSINLNGGSPKAWGSTEVLASCKEALLTIREKAAHLVGILGDPIGEADEHAAALLPLWRIALLQVKETYAALKRDRRALDFTDLEQLTRQLLIEFPQVCVRYRDAEFKHILVDEFQDTNAAQRDIIYALADPERPGSLFVVGDPKQSIYHFRGADVSVFNMVRDELIRWRGQQVNLNVSFRSHQMLVRGFNKIFEQVLGAVVEQNFEVAFDEPMEAQRETADETLPTLEIILIDKNNAEEGRRRADELRRWEAWELAKRLYELVEAETLIWDKASGSYRTMRYGDAAVLFRSTHSMPLVEDAFKAVGIPYLTIAGRGFYDRPEVWDLLNLLKALYNPIDDLSLAAALRSPLFNLSDDALLRLRIEHQGISLWYAVVDGSHEQSLKEQSQVLFAQDVLRRLATSVGRIPISELLLRILRETGYLAALAGLPDGTRRVSNVDKLLEMSRRSGRSSLGEFIAHLQDLSDRETREGEAIIEAENLVRLMTIHASKGLEFPVVAIFDAAWERKPRSAILVLDADANRDAACCVQNDQGEKLLPFAYRQAQQLAQRKEAAEEKRLLYVALTRAQDYVIVSGRREKRERENWLNQILDALHVEAIENTTSVQTLEWGSVLLRVPQVQPDDSLFTVADNREAAWDQLTTLDLVEPTADSEPTLLQPMVTPFDSGVREMHAQDLAVLGEVKPNLTQFRSYLFNDAPTEIKTTTYSTSSGDSGTKKLSSSQIGEIVHRALRFNRLPENTPELDKLLGIYAWEQGIIQLDQLQEATAHARELLSRIEHSWIMDKLRRADQIYRELPFTYVYTAAASQRTINGVIDVAFFEDRQWHVLDYKTAFVDATLYGQERHSALEQHSQKYHQQMGIYAAALEHKLGQTPQVYIHYVRYAWTVTVPESSWRLALTSLEDDLQQVIESRQD